MGHPVEGPANTVQLIGQQATTSLSDSSNVLSPPCDSDLQSSFSLPSLYGLNLLFNQPRAVRRIRYTKKWKPYQLCSFFVFNIRTTILQGLTLAFERLIPRQHVRIDRYGMVILDSSDTTDAESTELTARIMVRLVKRKVLFHDYNSNSYRTFSYHLTFVPDDYSRPIIFQR